jgi:hypothetical protein
MWCIAECARPGGGKTPPAVWDTPERHETDETAIVSTYGLGMPVGRAAAGTQRLWNPLCLREAARPAGSRVRVGESEGNATQPGRRGWGRIEWG